MEIRQIAGKSGARPVAVASFTGREVKEGLRKPLGYRDFVVLLKSKLSEEEMDRISFNQICQMTVNIRREGHELSEGLALSLSKTINLLVLKTSSVETEKAILYLDGTLSHNRDAFGVLGSANLAAKKLSGGSLTGALNCLYELNRRESFGKEDFAVFNRTISRISSKTDGRGSHIDCSFHQ